MNQDQKHALYIGGGILAAAVLWYLYNQGSIVPGSAPATVATPDAPGYMSFNVQPLNQSPLIPPLDYALPSGLGCGCSSGNDGCFNSNLDSGQSPVSMGQAMAVYREQNPNLYNAILDQLKVYKVA